MLDSVLIANRGEIACRIARTARALGMRVVVIHTDAERDGPFVRLADRAMPVSSYLAIEEIVAAALDAKAACIHPGYGFLAENAAFAEHVAARGLVFVGPPPAAIRAMGLKDGAKAIMQKAGVPVLPGYAGEAQDDAKLARAAEEVGYPLMIKAVAGGGGKGMRRVDDPSSFVEALAACRREAQGAFGDPRVLLECCVDRPRHIEVQVFADRHGNVVHLFERDCSLQRRHQKVIEETPAPGLSDTLRAEMTAAAVRAAKAVGYEGAGTVEFIASTDGEGRPDGFWFMEMNTRLQVEHPVTEMVTGLDLVEWQFRVASGEALPLSQDDIVSRGHAVEARLYAESPAAGFLPQLGRLRRLRWPAASPGLRIDTGVEEGSEVTASFDPMIAKLIAHAPARDAALSMLVRALEQTTLLGVTTNRPFLAALLSQPDVVAGRVDTGLIARSLADLVSSDAAVIAGGVLKLVHAGPRGLPFGRLAGWSFLGIERVDRLSLTVNGHPAEVTLAWQRDGSVSVGLGDRVLTAGDVLYADDQVCFLANGKPVVIDVLSVHGHVFAAGADGHVDIAYRALDGRRRDGALGETTVRAPMPGKLSRLLVRPGQAVAAGDRLAILEAMKMEHLLTAAVDGTVERIEAREGEQVEEGRVLMEIASGGEGSTA
ncbi:MAG: biotin carboxylase N-terminal domain-containing protein [Hyphomicrobiales bacterium]